MMFDERPPLNTVLREDVEDERIDATWRAVARSWPAQPRRSNRWRLVLVGVAAAGIAWWLSRPTPAPPRPPMQHGRMIEFADGSRVTLERGAALTSLGAEDGVVAFELRSGRVTFDVRASRLQWRVDATWAQFDVAGSTFTMERASDQVTVDVARGVVRVTTSDAERLVRMGERFVVSAPADPPKVTAPPSTTAPTDRGSPSAVVRSALPSWAALVERGNDEAIRRRLTRADLRRVGRDESPEVLLYLSDLMRMDRRPEDATRLLHALVERYPEHAITPLAAFTLGLVQLDDLERPVGAAKNLETAIRLGLPPVNEEDARARLVDAYERANLQGEVKRAAAEYFEHFPNGRHAATVRRFTP